MGKAINNSAAKKILFPLIILFFLVTISAQELPNFQDKYANDFAHLFTDNEVQQLRTLLYEVEQNTTAEVVVVTINTTSPLAPSQYRTELFNYWKIGKEDKDNGLLILYALSENRIEVETGYGLEGILPDSKLGRMLDEFYVPYRDQGNVTLGIILFTQEVSKVIEQNKDEVISGQEGGNLDSSDSWVIYFVIFVIIILTLFAVLGKLRSKQAKKKPEKKERSIFAKIVNIAFWITLVLFVVIGFNIFLIILLIILFILKAFLFPVSGAAGPHHWNRGFGSGSSFSSGGGGFGGGGFGGGMSGGGGVGR